VLTSESGGEDGRSVCMVSVASGRSSAVWLGCRNGGGGRKKLGMGVEAVCFWVRRW
jgi:hypothetical protein